MESPASLDEHRRKRIRAFERKMLQELSLQSLNERTHQYFSPFFPSPHVYRTAIENMAAEIGLEAYMLGAEGSRYSYHYGEELEKVRKRTRKNEKELTSHLYDYLTYWHAAATGNEMAQESLYLSCEHYICTWWEEGFENGVRRYRLRLHE